MKCAEHKISVLWFTQIWGDSTISRHFQVYMFVDKSLSNICRKYSRIKEQNKDYVEIRLDLFLILVRSRKHFQKEIRSPQVTIFF